MIGALVIAIAAVAGQSQQPKPADLYHQVPGCPVDLDAMLKLSPYDFDQTDKGWRSVETKPECYVATADLIATYRRAN